MQERIKRLFGAHPPAWQIGKTAASIRFVNNAEKFLATCQDEEKAQLLLEATRRIRSGEWILQEGINAIEYLALERLRTMKEYPEQQIPKP